MGVGELERVLQEVGDGRRQQLAVRLDGNAVLHRRDGEIDLPRLCIERRRHLDLLDELGEKNARSRALPARQPHLGQGAIDQLAQSRQAALEHGAGASPDGDGAVPEELKGHGGGGDEVAQLVREEAQALDLLIGDVPLALARVVGDGLGDGVVEAKVEEMELIRAEVPPLIACQLDDRLADVPIIVDHLGDDEAAPQQVVAVHGGAAADCLTAGRSPFVASRRAVNWVRKSGTPFSTSSGVARGAERARTFPRV
jgi:hypothetical protein